MRDGLKFDGMQISVINKRVLPRAVEGDEPDAHGGGQDEKRPEEAAVVTLVGTAVVDLSSFLQPTVTPSLVIHERAVIDLCPEFRRAGPPPEVTVSVELSPSSLTSDFSLSVEGSVEMLGEEAE